MRLMLSAYLQSWSHYDLGSALEIEDVKLIKSVRENLCGGRFGENGYNT